MRLCQDFFSLSDPSISDLCVCTPLAFYQTTTIKVNFAPRFGVSPTILQNVDFLIATGVLWVQHTPVSLVSWNPY